MEKELLKQVLIEATNLREAITEEERGNLRIAFFNPQVTYGCIYGLISGDCFNERAAHLIAKCCKKVLVSHKGMGNAVTNSRFSTIAPEKAIAKHENRECYYYSPIEKYILLVELEKSHQLIAYLKKQTDTFAP